MKSITKTPTTANGLLHSIDRNDPEQVAIAFRLLRDRHRQRPDVRAKLLQLAERKQGAAT